RCGGALCQFFSRVMISMKLPLATCSVLFTVYLLSASNLAGADPQPKLFASVTLRYQDDFSASQLDLNHWQVRQGTTWKVQDGVLVGSPSPKEYQEKKVAEGDKAHAGFKPVIWLEKVPENLLVQFRVRFDAKAYQPKFPLIDMVGQQQIDFKGIDHGGIQIDDVKVFEGTP
ncbi:MAG: hypothetical protein ACK53L_32880, partial [Pirellulaceae bacterium]